jgi:hypothetical protein
LRLPVSFAVGFDAEQTLIRLPIWRRVVTMEMWVERVPPK